MSNHDWRSEAQQLFCSGLFENDLRRRVAIQSDSQTPGNEAELTRYLDELQLALEPMGFSCEQLANPAGAGPLLFCSRIEGITLPTVLMYGHGDVVPGHDEQWRTGLSPWELVIDGDHWYGRGTADNKGQHTVNLSALQLVLKAREGRLGFNIKMLFETGEERGSPGLREVCAQNKDRFQADVFIASDGPRLNAERPTVFLGSRGSVLFSLHYRAREAGLHSGNWGGVKINPATVLANALASLVSGQGGILCSELLPGPIPKSVRKAIADLDVNVDSLGQRLDADWGESGLSLGERLFGWNTLEVLAFGAGNMQKPVNAIPPVATMHCQLRFVVGTQWQALETIVRRHLDAHGYQDVEVKVERSTPATRLDPEDVWVQFATQSMTQATGKKIAILPNLAGTLPNEVFSDVLQLPTLWIPHSYPGCAQHAPNEHALQSILEEGVHLMAALFWDLGEASVRPKN